MGYPDYTGHRARLRERWDRAGGEGFADYELLELLLTYAIPRKDTKPLAKALLAKFGTLKAVLDAPAPRLAEIDGIGETAAGFVGILRAVMARYFEAQARTADLLNSPETVVAFCRSHLEGLPHEVFDVLYLSTKNRLIGRKRLSEGTIDQTAVYPRRVVTEALAANAASVIFVHNHPSGDPTPSPDDRRLTLQLSDAAKTVGISVLDHVIVGNGRHYSFREKGIL